MLDYLWAGLPVVTTTGDGFAELVAEHGIGRAVPPADVDALACALEELLGDVDARRVCITSSRALARRFEWSTVLEPLATFCRRPQRSADAPVPHVATASHTAPPGRSGVVRDFRTAARVFRERGATGLAEVVRTKVASLRSC